MLEYGSPRGPPMQYHLPSPPHPMKPLSSLQTPMPILQHLHLPNLTPYAHASRLQELLVSRLLRYKAVLSKSSVQNHPTPPLPPPTILTFTPHPIYTTGRRETTPPSSSQLAFLKQPLQTEQDGVQVADFAQALRGGQITFHGPGQLVVYPIFSLAHPYSFAPGTADSPTGPSNNKKSSLSPRCYVHLLESCTIATLARYGIQGMRTTNPGVWVSQDTKIAALGVHLRRNVTSHGVGLNVWTDLRWFERIVACGLEGKRVTSMWEDVRRRNREDWRVEIGGRDGVRDMIVEEVAGLWVSDFARECGLKAGDVVKVSEKDVLAQGDAEGA